MPTTSQQNSMEEEDDLDLGLEDELEKALEMEEGVRHVAHDLTIFGPIP